MLFGKQLIQNEDVRLSSTKGLGELLGMVEGREPPTHFLELLVKKQTQSFVIIKDPEIDWPVCFHVCMPI